jgi:deazaflavin-dependent oxidoreductase (nitroreductase family)
MPTNLMGEGRSHRGADVAVSETDRTGAVGGGGRGELIARPPLRRVVSASIVLAALNWIVWFVTPHGDGVPSALWWSLFLVVLVGLTAASPSLKRRFVRFVQRWIVNPPVRVLLAIGVPPLGFALIETIGRRSGKPRRTPVGNGLIGQTFWIVAEHGHDAGYVRNVQHDARVRVKARRGLRAVWLTGIATVMENDDPYARQRMLARWHPLRALNAAIVRVMGTTLVTVRIDLDG